MVKKEREFASRVLSAFLALVVLGGAVLGGLQLWGKEDWKPSNWGSHAPVEDNEDNKDNEGENKPDDGEDKTSDDECVISVTPDENTSAFALRVSAPASDDGIATTADTATSKLVTASISTTIANPKVDWSVERADGSAVTEVTITPTSDGALTATVTCKSAFEDVIRIKGEIRGLGVCAYANVFFEGKPTSISASVTGFTYSGGYYKAPGTGTYSAPITLSNAFGVVGSNYNDFELVSVERCGSVKFVPKATMNGTQVTVNSSYDPITVNFSEAAFTYQNRTGDQFFPVFTGFDDGYMNFSLSGSSINVNVLASLSSWNKVFRSTSSSMLSYVYWLEYDSMPSTCYYKVTVREKTSGLSTSFNVTFSDAMMTSFTLGDDIVF